MKIRVVTINNLVFDLSVKSDDINSIISKIYDRKYIQVNDKTYINTNAIAIIQKM